MKSHTSGSEEMTAAIIDTLFDMSLNRSAMSTLIRALHLGLHDESIYRLHGDIAVSLGIEGI